MRFIITLSLAAMALASPMARRTWSLHQTAPASNLTERMVLSRANDNSTSGEGFTCASDQYSADQVKASADAACNYIQQGQTADNSKYPEKMDDREGFQWPVDGPYYEFPIMNDGSVYDGGEPGADRLVLNDQCDIAGGVTHTGGSNDNFVQCSSS